jgi:hypothetical protein
MWWSTWWRRVGKGGNGAAAVATMGGPGYQDVVARTGTLKRRKEVPAARPVLTSCLAFID